jgi:hypothetical protein
MLVGIVEEVWVHNAPCAKAASSIWRPLVDKI